MDTATYPKPNLNIPNQVTYTRDATASIGLSNFAANQVPNMDDHFDMGSFVHNSSPLSSLPSHLTIMEEIDMNPNCASEVGPLRGINVYASGRLVVSNPDQRNVLPSMNFLPSNSSSSRMYTNSFHNPGPSHHDPLADIHGNSGFIQGGNDSLKSAENPSADSGIGFENRDVTHFQHPGLCSNSGSCPCPEFLQCGPSDAYLVPDSLTVLDRDNFQENYFVELPQNEVPCNWQPSMENDACVVESYDADNCGFSNGSSSRTDSNDTDVNESLETGNDELPPVQLSSKLPSSEIRNSSKKTAYNEKWGVKVFKAWCKQNEIEEEFEKLTAEGLNDLLTKFWKTIRKSNGDLYGRNSLFNLRAMINKHLKGEPNLVTFDIVTDDRFRLSNECLDEQLKCLKIMGRKIAHKLPISPKDIQKLYESEVFSTTTPISLLRKVWFEVTLHFCPKGGESQEKIQKTTFKIFTEAGRRYVARSTSIKQEGKIEARMYDTYGSLCPVKSFEFYLSKLHPMQPRLFQQPRKKTNENSTTWYGKSPIGEKALQQMMANISKEAALSKRYTNHCVRTTALQQFTELRKQYEALDSTTADRNSRVTQNTGLSNRSHLSAAHQHQQTGRVENMHHRNALFVNETNRGSQDPAALHCYQPQSFGKCFIDPAIPQYSHAAATQMVQQHEPYPSNSCYSTFLGKQDNGLPIKNCFPDPAPLSFRSPPSYSEHQFNKLSSQTKGFPMKEMQSIPYESQTGNNFSDASHSNLFMATHPQSSSHVAAHPPPPYSPFPVARKTNRKVEPDLSPNPFPFQSNSNESRGLKKNLKTENHSKTIVAGFPGDFGEPRTDGSKGIIDSDGSI